MPRCVGVVVVWCLVFGAAASAKPQAAQRANDFVNSIGVNTHFGNATYPENAYADRRIDAKLAALGVRHIRDHSYNDVATRRVDELFKKHGIRATLVLGETTRSPAEIVKLLKAQPAYEAVEGLNEPDFAKRTYKNLADAKDDYAATRAFQDELYAAIKADAKTKDIPVLSPAMGRSNRSQFLLPIKFDIAAMHRYSWEGKSVMEPSFRLDDAVADMAKLRGDKPLWATESGYYNFPADHARAAPEDVAGKYVPRLLAEFFNRGAERTYLYELADQGTDKTAREQNFGLLRHDMTEKPAYVALRNMVALLKDPKAREFTPASLDFTLDGATDQVHHALLQKGDGTFWLLLWQEVLSYDGATKAKVEAAPIDVTLTLAEPREVTTYAPGESTKPTFNAGSVKSFKIGVTDEVLIISLGPRR